MLSLYIHIPFCDQKCGYCSFSSFSVNDSGIIENYIKELIKEIKHYGKIFTNKELRTLYIGGGTPSKIGLSNLIRIIDTVRQNFSLENIEEFSIELNPNPFEEVLDIVEKLTIHLKDLPRVRFSFGIQSFDDKVLKTSGRQYGFLGIVEFLRNLQAIKQENNVFNFDFIAFGEFNTTKKGNIQLRDPYKLEFFQILASSGFADSFSLYTLELFEGSKRHHQLSKEELTKNENDDNIYEEFAILKDILLEAGYNRYELSNFALPGKNSIHNMIYRNMDDYLGVGLSSSSYLDKTEILKFKNDDLGNFGTLDSNSEGIRFTNTSNIKDYLTSQRIDKSKTENMTQVDYLIEKFFLNLRTNKGIKDISEFETVLVKDYQTKIESYQGQGFLNIDGKKMSLTDSGMDVFNSIITELLEKI